MAKNIYLLRNIKPVVSESVALMAYHSLIESYLTYALLSWGHAPAAKRLFGLQRRAVRVLAGIGYRDDCRDYFRALAVMTLPSLYVFQCLKYMRTDIHYFSARSYLHDHNTRTSSSLVLPFNRLSANRLGITYYGPLLYNLLTDYQGCNGCPHSHPHPWMFRLNLDIRTSMCGCIADIVISQSQHKFTISLDRERAFDHGRL